MKIQGIILPFIFNFFINIVTANAVLRPASLQEGARISELIANNTIPEIITTSWVQSSDEKVFNLGRIPAIKKFSSCFRKWSCWMEPAIGLQLSEVPAETQYFLGDLGSERYVMIIPLVDDHFRSSLQGTPNNELVVVIESGDTQIKTTQSASLYLSTGSDPYQMIKEASEQLSDYLKTFRLRKDKSAPWYVDHLGWHSWNAFYQFVSQDSTIKALNNFKKRKLPIEWIMIDDGVQGQKDLKLNSFDADPVKFPGGLKGIIDIARQQYGIKKVFVWTLLWGYWRGIDTTVFKNYRLVKFVPPPRYKYLSGKVDNVKREDILKEATVGADFYPNNFLNQSFYIPGPTFGKFYYDYFDYLRKQGVGGIKVDAMTWAETLGTNGKGGRIKMMRDQLDGLQTAGDVHFCGEIINCSSCSNDYFFNTLTSNVTRSSTDFFPNIPKSHGNHINTNAHTSFWIGNIVLPDWDMFQTGHSAGAFHAAARAISGGPIYISDEVGKENIEIINALATSKGRLLRSLDYGQVCRDNLFTDIKKGKVAIKIFNNNVCNSIVGTFNCSYNNENPIVVSSEVKPEDVEGIRGNSFAVFNFKTGALIKSDSGGKNFEKIQPLDFNLYTISPIVEGFAPVGLLGKYNSGAAITKLIQINKKEWLLELMEGGDLLCYADAKPKEVLFNGTPVGFTYKEKKLTVNLPLQDNIVVKVGF